MATLGERFKQLRNEKGMTQEEMSNDFNKKYHFNFYKQTLSNYENDKRIPEVNALKCWAEYLGVSVDYLLGVNDKRKEDEKDDDPDMRMIARARKEMSEEDREKMMSVMKIIFSDYF